MSQYPRFSVAYRAMPAPRGTTTPATNDEEMRAPLIESKNLYSMINGGSDASGLLEEDEERKHQ